MLKSILILTLCAAPIYSWASSIDKPDPFRSVENFQLKNGLDVYLAQGNQDGLISIRLEVDVGVMAEEKANWGVSHLLEHVLFRDKQLKDEMSYLQMIKEAGGSANGTTEEIMTSYFGSIPAEKGPWLLDLFGKMILAPSITDENVTKEKGTVELERGKPGPITVALGFAPEDYFFPRYLKPDTFWESEFGISFNENYTRTEEQLSTRRLTADQVRTHYKNYYYPSNMRIFIAGQFNRKEIMARLEKDWAAMESRKGLTNPRFDQIHPKDAPYIRAEISNSKPTVFLGTKVWDIDIRQDFVLRSYMNYLAHRFMKEIRNKKGQTYTAQSKTDFQKGYGTAGIEFETTEENYSENLKFARDFLLKEAVDGGLTDAQVEEAKDLYLAQYLLMGKNAESMANIARQSAWQKRTYGAKTSPWQLAREITTSEYSKKLNTAFVPAHAFEVLTEPPLLFHYDWTVSMAISLIVSFLLFKKFFSQSFRHDGIRWVRKSRFPPLKTLEIGAMIGAWFLYCHALFVINSLLLNIPSLRASVIFSGYISNILGVILFILSAQVVFSLFPRKLMVVDNDLVIKSISYFSKKIPLSEIESVETLRAFSLLKSHRFLAVLFRYRFFDPLFWRQGLYVKLKNGKAHFFSLTEPEKAKMELQGFLPMNAVPRIDVRNVA